MVLSLVNLHLILDSLSKIHLAFFKMPKAFGSNQNIFSRIRSFFQEMCVNALPFRCISATQDQTIIFSMTFGSFSDHKCGTNLSTYEVDVPLSGSVTRFGLLVSGLNLEEGGNNIKCSLWSLLLKYNPFKHKI